MASIIGVETLQHTNGTTAATIDSSGRILQPAKPAFYAYADDGWQGLTSDVWAAVNLDHTRFNQGNHYNTSTSEFVAPVAGIYHFSAQGYYDGHTNRARLGVFKNGAQIALSFVQADGTAYTAHISTMAELAVGDAISLEIRLDAADGSSDYYLGENQTFLAGYLVA